MARKKTPPLAADEAATQAKYDAWLADCRQYQDDVARELAAAPDPHQYLANLAVWNDAVEAAAAQAS